MSPAAIQLDRNAATTATTPMAAMARPLTSPIHRATDGVMRVVSNAASAASTHHQVADPTATPATTIAGGANPPRSPAPRAAARAMNETIVVGLVTVRPRVDAYAHARPRPVVWAEVPAARRFSRTALNPTPISAAPPTSVKGFAPPVRTVVTAAIPKTAIAA